MRNELAKLVTFKEGNILRSANKLEIIITSMIHKAMKGDLNAFKLVAPYILEEEKMNTNTSREMEDAREELRKFVMEMPYYNTEE